MKRKETAVVKEQRQLSADIYSLRLQVTFADEVKAGQFVSLFSSDGSRLLPRPISVCEADPVGDTIRVVYRVVGRGTEEFSRLAAGDRIDVMGPLGNGFPLEKAEGKRLLLIGGGIGIPPMLAVAKALQGRAEMVAALGYRTKETYLLEEMAEVLGCNNPADHLADHPTNHPADAVSGASSRLLISTDDGSLGVKGTVLDAIREAEKTADLIFACGPKVMLKAVKEYAAERGIPCYVSMEEHMACGIGVCLGCVCKTTEVDAHSLVKNARVCADGPVFEAGEVDLS